MAYETTSNAGGVETATQVVVGLFKNASDAHQALTELRAQGFSSSQIGAAFRSRVRFVSRSQRCGCCLQGDGTARARELVGEGEGRFPLR
jgi:hypothetical protein